MQAPKHLLLSCIAAAALFAAGGAACTAQSTPSPSPSPSPAATPAASPSPARYEGPLYPAGDDIYTIDRETTAYYYFQGNTDGSGKAKQELRYARNLWTDNAQIKLRLPSYTVFPLTGNPYSGYGNTELGYWYGIKGDTLDHSLEIRAAFPTATNGVQSLDTQLKGFYNLKWKLGNGLAINYLNEYDQTIIKPPGASWTSYYEGDLTLPYWAFAEGYPGLKLSAFYYYRVLFDSGAAFKDALGVNLAGSMKDVSLTLTDTWGLGGGSKLWLYKFEANLSARF